MKYLLTFLLPLLLFCPTNSALAEEGIIVQMSTVYDKASSRSDRVARIEAGAKVSVFERQGGWKLIFSNEKALTGWVRSYQVRSGYYVETPAVENETDSRGFLAGLASFSRKASSFFGGGKSNTSTQTATIGVRGLSEEEIRTALPDFEELEKMHQHASNAQRMSAFSRDGKLVTNQIAHLKAAQSD
jgi:hypothetical protein